MPKDYDMIIRINSELAEVEVEQHSKSGVIIRKNISPQSLSDCILTSRYDDESHATGLLPEGCVAVVMDKKHVYYYIRYPELYADFSYFGTEYPNFPIPRLIFRFKYMLHEHKVAESALCVVKDQRLTPDTPTYYYPFSNVGGDGRICIGNNALPVYKDPARLHTLAAYILRMPNNNDHFSKDHNKLHAEFRDLLEQMKGKTPSHYYTDVLVENRGTLKDFLGKR